MVPDPTWIRNDELRTWVEAFNANAQVSLIIDADNSGGMVSDMGVNMVPGLTVTSYKDDPQPGVQVTTYQADAQPGFDVTAIKSDPQPGFDVSTYAAGTGGFVSTVYKALSPIQVTNVGAAES